jgi:hypothetical protein
MSHCCCLASLSKESKESLLIILLCVIPVELFLAIYGLIPIIIGNNSGFSIALLTLTSVGLSVSIIAIWSIVAFNTEHRESCECKRSALAWSIGILVFVIVIVSIVSIVIFSIDSEKLANTGVIVNLMEYVFEGTITSIIGLCVIVLLIVALCACLICSCASIKTRSDEYHHKIVLAKCPEGESMICV